MTDIPEELRDAATAAVNVMLQDGKRWREEGAGVFAAFLLAERLSERSRQIERDAKIAEELIWTQPLFDACAVQEQVADAIRAQEPKP